jgi:hypothetical protein
VLRLGGADNRAHSTQAGLSQQAPGELVDEGGKSLVQRRLWRRQILQVGGAGVAGPDQREHPGSSLGGGGEKRLEGVAPEQRVGGEGVRPEARDRPPRRRRLPDEGLPVGGGGDRDVAALAVGDDQEAGILRRFASRFQRLPSGCAEPLEAGQLGLDGDAGGARLLDQDPAVLGDRGGGELSGRRLGVPRLRPRSGQLGRIGVEAEADLAAALFDERREPIGKASQRISRP